MQILIIHERMNKHSLIVLGYVFLLYQKVTVLLVVRDGSMLVMLQRLLELR